MALDAPGQKPQSVTKDIQGGKKVNMMGGAMASRSLSDNGANLRTYRLALACTGEYAQFHGGTVSSVLAAMNTSMARVNGLFERDVCLTMELVPNNDQLIFFNGNTDPFTNNSGGTLLYENINTFICFFCSAFYDIGNVFFRAGGWRIWARLVGQGWRGHWGGSPVNDPFDVDYVAHRMGHQYGGNHTQNNSCNRASSAAYEPGSATTIMGYAGICAPNLQSNSDDHFHNTASMRWCFHGQCGNTCFHLRNNGVPTVVRCRWVDNSDFTV